MSQEELAESIWVSRNTISNWETGVTQPDLASLILLSALFNLSIDEMVRDDERVIARAVERDRRHLLLLGRDERPAGWESGGYEISKPLPEGVPAYNAPDEIAWGEASAPLYRVKLVSRFMSRARFDVIDRAGARVGRIMRRHGLFAPVFFVRFAGLPHVKLERVLKVGDGVQTLYRIVGGGLSLEGNVLGPDFSVLRGGDVLAHVSAGRVGPRAVFRLDLDEDPIARLAFGIVVALLLMRDYDRVWARDA